MIDKGEEQERGKTRLVSARVKCRMKLDALKIKIILNQIENTRNRVNKIFTQLADTSHKGDQLGRLRAANHITDEQYAKLIIGPNTLH